MDGYSARRTLSVRLEMIRQLRRRRTAVALALVLALPIVVVLAVKFGPSAGGGGGGLADGDLDVFGLMATGPWNFALSGLLFTSAFLLVLLAAMFLGDTVASEASWSTLRYLLVAPVPRRRVLAVKLIVGLISTLAILLVLVLASFLLGWIAFGGEGLATPLGGELGAGESTTRLAIVTGYIAITLLVPAGVAFLASVSTDVPLGAVGAGVLVVVVANILDIIDALGPLRQLLPTNYASAWSDALGPVIVWDQMAVGLAYNVGVFAVLVGIAFLRFERKDILS
jgi:ABC-2 type transport system permease protein